MIDRSMNEKQTKALNEIVDIYNKVGGLFSLDVKYDISKPTLGDDIFVRINFNNRDLSIKNIVSFFVDSKGRMFNIVGEYGEYKEEFYNSVLDALVGSNSKFRQD